MRDLGIENANNKNEGKTYHKDLSRIIDETIASLELSKEELKDLPNYKVKLFERDNVFTNLLVKTRQLIERFYVGF